MSHKTSHNVWISATVNICRTFDDNDDGTTDQQNRWMDPVMTGDRVEAMTHKMQQK